MKTAIAYLLVLGVSACSAPPETTGETTQTSLFIKSMDGGPGPQLSADPALCDHPAVPRSYESWTCTYPSSNVALSYRVSSASCLRINRDGDISYGDFSITCEIDVGYTVNPATYKSGSCPAGTYVATDDREGCGPKTVSPWTNDNFSIYVAQSPKNLCADTDAQQADNKARCSAYWGANRESVYLLGARQEAQNLPENRSPTQRSHECCAIPEPTLELGSCETRGSWREDVTYDEPDGGAPRVQYIPECGITEANCQPGTAPATRVITAQNPPTGDVLCSCDCSDGSDAGAQYFK